MIRDKVKSKIFNSLNYDIFRIEDFNISDELNGDTYNICITYENSYFNLEFSSDCGYCRTTCRPGDVFIKNKSRIDLDVFESNVSRMLQSWMKRIKDELVNPIEQRFINSELQNFKKQLDNRLDEIEDSLFSKEEGEELKNRLELLEKMVQDRMGMDDESEAEIRKMREEIEFLRATVDTLTKKKWIKNALVKIWVWGQKPENQKLIESGISTVKAISQMDIPEMK